MRRWTSSDRYAVTAQPASRAGVRVLLLMAAIASGTPSMPAHADDQSHANEHVPDDGKPLTGEVLVVLASEAGGTIDPSLSRLRALKHPPFNAFKSMKILSRQSVSLNPDEPVAIELPKKRWLVLTLTSRLADGRAKVQLSINKPNKQDYLPLLNVIISAGEPFFVAGQKFEGGTLVVGVRLGERGHGR
jgi:hypothetical protein